jgi:gamma-tubulin complex component 4
MDSDGAAAVSHEVLLALLGHPGNIIVEKNETFVVSADISFLSVAEKETINRIVWLGYQYRQLVVFTEQQCFASQRGSARAGLYCRALCAGIEERISAYRQAISDVEQDILYDPDTNLSHIHCAVSEHIQTIPAMSALVTNIEKHAVTGGAILDELHRCASSGFPVIKACFERLHHHCHKVMYNHILAWVMYGTLNDRYNEFFVRSEQNGQAGFTGSLGIGVEDDNQSRYSLDLAQLPSIYFPTQLAEVILFIGNAVQVLRHHSGESFSLQESQGNLFSEEDIQAFKMEIYALKTAPTFHHLSVECAIERMRATIARRLWHLVVVQSKLLDHLSAIKSYMLLARGEFFLTFIELSLPMLSQLPSQRAEIDLHHGPWTQAARICGVEDDPNYRRLRLRLHRPCFDFRSFGNTQGLTLVGTAVYMSSSQKIQLAAPLPLQASNAAEVEWPGGAIWCSDPKEMLRSFSTRVTFQVSAAESYGTGFAFVLQNQRLRALGQSGRYARRFSRIVPLFSDRTCCLFSAAASGVLESVIQLQ